MHLLVTGGAGFIGSNYVRRALAGEYGEGVTAVTVLDKLTYAGNLANLAPVADSSRFRFVQGDIGDAQLLRRVLPGVDAVVNFAAESHVDRSIGSAGEFVTTNVVGTQVLLQAALEAGVPRFVHVSTDEVYGSIDSGSWTEEWPLEPNSPYAAAKGGADLLVRAYARTHGMNVSITRCSNNYGPYQFPEKVIPLFVTTLMRGGSVPLYGDGLNIRDWLHVDDHCRGIHLVLEQGQPGEVYNIGGGRELTNRQLTGLLLDACGADWGRVRNVADRKGHDRRYSLDDSKLRALGYRPQVAFEQGLADTVAWYRENTDWWQPLVAVAA
ncbi:dTDP-glucose 4,6-dehydratase [Streptomyces sp. VRA16 Mangrove soil]|uniref:dTDP-glucose 4,6-dehydratase n=1 Tax=Streptomyces sp. VRA16 Mangrove soil TaxID=2817434 RepID=UPI001A9EBDBD|nr:dTDP-glucose 4,6-dehydratase [Streptomyces sp. VRA16 Mangrove soil]MBO1337167.1 dTDP-glucose 4,6-dehydratase [Streptomyces sp. VRA16 Mangrove soil]